MRALGICPNSVCVERQQWCEGWGPSEQIGQMRGRDWRFRGKGELNDRGSVQAHVRVHPVQWVALGWPATTVAMGTSDHTTTQRH